MAKLQGASDLEKFIKTHKIIKNFICFNSNISYKVELDIQETTEIGFKELKNKWLKKYCSCKSIWLQEYWLERGHSYEEAILNINSYQKSNAEKSAIKIKEEFQNNKDEFKKKRSTFKEYWINKGYTEEQALQKLKERQNTTSKSSMIKKYGPEIGEKKFNERNKKWINSLYNKSPEEIKKINDSKAVLREKMIYKYGNIEGTKRWLNYINAHSNMIGKGSKIANKYISEIIKNINLPNDDLFYADKKEFYIFDNVTNKIFFYDFTIISKKIIIEFNGQHIHPNPELHNKNTWTQSFTKKSFSECLDYDIYKKSLAEKQGFKILTIWFDKNESEVQENKLNECLNFINKN